MKIFWILLYCFTLSLSAQPTFPPLGYVYDDTSIPKIYLEIPTDSLQEMYENPWNEKTYRAKFIFQRGAKRDTVALVGLEIRGNTSRNAKKKSMQVDINHYVRGQEFYGLEALNLNGEHNDPSLIRSKLVWDLMGTFKVPASRANHAEVYINNKYFGIYANIEPIDDEFVKSRFGSDSGNLYKCLYPANLGWLGNDPNLYKKLEGTRRIYELRTNETIDDYTDLRDLIYTITQLSGATFQIEIQKKFNVDVFLKALAVEVVVGHWDNYWGNQNNYYLYKNPATGKFEYIPYDADNTFGIDWIGGDWGTKNVFSWASTSLTSRPLINKILGVPEWKNRYAYYLKQLQDKHFNLAQLSGKIDAYKVSLYDAALRDTLRDDDYGWSITDFQSSYENALGGHVDYGLKSYISTRNNYTTSQLGTVANVAPIVRYENASPQVVRGGAPILFTAHLEDESAVLTVKLFLKEGTNTETFDMKDDGLNGDLVANDKIYNYRWLPPNRSANLTWYLTASDGTKVTTSVEMPVTLLLQTVFINELLASNGTGLQDEFGEFDDWIELWNSTGYDYDLNGTFLSDDPAIPNKWALPSQVLPPYGRILIWADAQVTQGALHTNFKLEKNGESVIWSKQNGAIFDVLDRIDFPTLVADKSYSRSGDGGVTWFIANVPTPNAPNNTATATENELPEGVQLSAYPNPFSQQISVQWIFPQTENLNVSIIDVLGRERAILFEGLTDSAQLKWESVTLQSGVYWIRFKMGENTWYKRIVKI